MKSQKLVTKTVSKRIVMNGLYLGAALILLLGTFFCTYSIKNHIVLPVLNTSVHGAVFGVLVAYLGVKYFMLVNQFGTRLYQSNEPFQWKNFRRNKQNKGQIKENNDGQREKRGGAL